MKFLIATIFSLVLSASIAQSDSALTEWEFHADSVVSTAMSQLGASYKWGTCSPGKCFDCSGLTYYAYQSIGIYCPRSSSGLYEVGEDVDLYNARKGDLLLFRGTDPNDQSVGHVGIVISNEDEELEFIHCSSSSKHYGVVITEYYSSGYPKRFIKAKRLIQ